MLAGFLQLKPLMKTSFTIAAPLVSYLITYEIICADFIVSICYLNVNLMVCDSLVLGMYWSTLVYDFLIGMDEEVVPFCTQQLRQGPE